MHFIVAHGRRSTYPNKGFTYSQPLAHRMSILHQNTGRVWKLSGDGPWTIGRSRKNSIQLTADPYLSRFHGTSSSPL